MASISATRARALGPRRCDISPRGRPVSLESAASRDHARAVRVGGAVGAEPAYLCSQRRLAGPFSGSSSSLAKPTLSSW